MLLFQLFRGKVTTAKQGDFFVSRSPTAVLRQALEAKPTAELRRGHEWHIGNLQQLDEQSYYFAIGRVTKRTVQLWDNEAESFTDAEYDGAPYTHAIADLGLELFAIAKKPELAPTTNGIARKLARLLEMAANDSMGSRCSIDLAPIIDPTDFLESLRTAYAIQRFSATFGLPNPWDVEKDFQKPIEDFTREVGGDKTKTTVSGANLDAHKLQDVTRSAAATGSDVQATLQPTSRSRPIKKSLKGDAFTYQVESVDDASEKADALKSARDYYQYVRDRSGRAD